MIRKRDNVFSYILIMISFLFFGCQVVTGNKIPEKVEVGGEVTIRHEVGVSIEMIEFFQSECKENAETAGLITGSIEYQAFIDLCVEQKTNEFIQLIEEILNGN